jgi:nucleolar complex protein 2
LLSHFHNIIRVLESLPKHSSDTDEESKDVQMTILTLQESAKLLPYVVGSRKAVKIYLKVNDISYLYTYRITEMPAQTCFDLWSSAEDNVQMAAFLSIRRLASANDESIVDLILKV